MVFLGLLFALLCFLLVSLLFKMVPKHSTKMLVRVPKCKKTMMYLTQKMCVLDKFHSSISYSSVGHEFSVNGSIIYSK